jgi:hypothetical protein
MEQRFFQQSVRFRLMESICRQTTKQIQTWRDGLAVDYQNAIVQRAKVMRAKRQHKLAMIDVAAMKTQ